MTLSAFGIGCMVLIGYGVMLLALLVLSKAATDRGIDAAGMAAEDPTWRAHIQTLRTLPFSAVRVLED